METPICRAEHFGLPARQPAILADWYVAVLGAEIVFAEPPAFLIRLPGGLLLEIYAATGEVAGTADNGVAGWRHLALRVDSIEAARAVLEPRGVRFDAAIKPAGGGGRVLFFRDAEGNLLHLVERPATSALF
jgi:glyoxylase I family protein